MDTPPSPVPVGPTLPTFAEHRSLRQQILDALRAALVAGEMRAGVVYSAPTLAAQFGVSPTPVREAMLDLAKEGLVEAVRNKGFRVTQLTDAELDEITSLRMMLEVPAVSLVVERGDDVCEHLEKLRETANLLVSLAEEADLVAYVEADRQFHLGLLELAGNRNLVELVRDLRARSRLYGLRELAERGQLARSAREHEELLDLLLAGDAAGATALMARHIGHVREEWAGTASSSAEA